MVELQVKNGNGDRIDNSSRDTERAWEDVAYMIKSQISRSKLSGHDSLFMNLLAPRGGVLFVKCPCKHVHFPHYSQE